MKNKTPIKPPVRGYHLAAEGLPLTKSECDDIANTMFTRFYQEEGGPDYKSAFMENTRGILNNRVKQVIDSLVIKGYLILKP